MPSAQIIQSQLTENPTHSIALSIRFISDMTLQIKMILYRGFNKCLPQFGKGPSSVGNKKRTKLAEVFTSKGLCFFGIDPLFEIRRLLAFTTFLCWLFLILILDLDFLTTLLLIFVCWTYY